MIHWIASYPKSGNTWIRLFLMAYQDPDGFDPNVRPENHCQDTLAQHYEAAAGRPLAELSTDELRLARGAALLRMGDAYVKTHSANVVVNGTAMIPPEITASMLYVLRDPRDIVVSYADHLDFSIDDTIACMADDQHCIHKYGTLRLPVMTWTMHLNSWMRPVPRDRFAVRYEDLLAEPRRWFPEILSFFGIEIEQTRLDRALALTAFDALRAREDESGYVGKGAKQSRFFRCGKAGAWKDVLTPAQVERIESDHHDAMQCAGYN